MTQYFQMWLFIASLQDDTCKELMRTAHGTFQATYEAAVDLEVIQSENKTIKPIIMMAAATTMNREELEAVNALCA